MTENEKKIMFDYMIAFLSEAKKKCTEKVEEALDRKLQLEEEIKRHTVEEKTIQGIIVSLKNELKKIEEKGD